MELVLLKCHSSREAFPIGTGMLCLSIHCERNYGLSMQESGYPNHTYQVVYHEKIDESITEAHI